MSIVVPERSAAKFGERGSASATGLIVSRSSESPEANSRSTASSRPPADTGFIIPTSIFLARSALTRAVATIVFPTAVSVPVMK